MATSTKTDTSKLARDIENLQKPTVSALGDALSAIEKERRELLGLEEHLAARLGELDKMEQTLRSLAPADASPNGTSAGNGKARTARPKRKAATKSRKQSVPLGDLAEQQMIAAGKPLSLDELAAQIKRSSGSAPDKRGLAGALNGGARSGRFVKTSSGKFKVPADNAA
jgi:hypothetical protein